MLLIHFSLAPTESVKELESSHWVLLCLQIVENALDTEGYTLEIINICRHLIDSSPESAHHKECL